MKAAMAMEAPKTVVPAEADELVKPTPAQTAQRAMEVGSVIVLERKIYWRRATVGVVIILASLEGPVSMNCEYLERPGIFGAMKKDWRLGTCW